MWRISIKRIKVLGGFEFESSISYEKHTREMGAVFTHNWPQTQYCDRPSYYPIEEFSSTNLNSHYEQIRMRTFILRQNSKNEYPDFFCISCEQGFRKNFFYINNLVLHKII